MGPGRTQLMGDRMADGGELEGAFGEDAADPETEAAAIEANSAAVGIAMDAAGGHAKARADASVVLLRAQTRLVDLQVKHFDEERRLAIEAAKIKRVMDWLKLAGLAAVAVVLSGAAIGLALVFWSASHDHSLVLESFSVPPDIAEHQLDGEELAALVADRLADIDEHSQSFRASATYQTDWGHEIHIELPATGVSLGELDRVLRERLGHQTRIGGVLYHDSGALRLSVRTGGGGAQEVEGDDEHIDALATKAAEAIFEKTQPYAYSKYLEFAGRMDEAMTVARKLADAGPPSESAWAWAQISNLLSARDLPGAYQAGMRSVAIDPNLALGWLNAANPLFLMGHDQAAVDLLARSVDVARNGGGGLSPIGLHTAIDGSAAGLMVLRADYLPAADIYRTMTTQLYAYSSETDSRSTNEAAALVAAHDVSGSRRLSVMSDARTITLLYYSDAYVAVEYQRAVEMEDWPAAIAAAQLQLDALAKAPEGPELTRYARERFALPNEAYALARAGRLGEALAISNTLAEDCYLCLRTKGRIAALAGNWPEVDRAFGSAVRQNPELPFADLDWGRALLTRGDLVGAIRHFSTAARLAPHFADPLEYWGDVLAAQGRPSDAIAKYAAAAPFAPAWGALHLAWGEALSKAGQADLARKQFALAGRLDLTAANRAKLAQDSAAAARPL